MNIESFIYTAACAVSAFTVLLVMGYRRDFSKLPGVFVAFLCVMSVRFVLELLIHLPTAPMKHLWLGLLMFSALLMAPLMHRFAWWVKHNGTSGTALGTSHQRLLLLVGFLCVMPLISQTHMGHDYHNPLNPLSEEHKLLINALQLCCAGVFAVQAPVFLQRTYKILQDVTGMRAPLYSAISNRQHNGLRFIVLAVMTTWIMGMCRVFHCWILGGPSNISLLFSTVEVAMAVLALASLLKPQSADSERRADDVRCIPKYQRSALDEAAIKRIQDKIQAALDDEALLTDNRLSLQSFSAHINENTHYVSQVINQRFSTNFFSLVNRRRAQLACLRLTQDVNVPVGEISETLGFNSKSTFNSAFKQLTLMTPSQYRQRHQLQ